MGEQQREMREIEGSRTSDAIGAWRVEDQDEGDEAEQHEGKVEDIQRCEGVFL